MMSARGVAHGSLLELSSLQHARVTSTCCRPIVAVQSRPELQCVRVHITLVYNRSQSTRSSAQATLVHKCRLWCEFAVRYN